MTRELKELIGEVILDAYQLGLDRANMRWDGDEPVYEVVYGPYILRRKHGELWVEVPIEKLSLSDDDVVIWQDGEWVEPGPWQDHLPSVVEVLSKKIEERRLALEEAQKARRKALYERAARQVAKFMQAGGRG